MEFKILSEITNIQIIAVGNNIKEIKRLRKFYGYGRWRKMKGEATIMLNNISIVHAEIHWYEAHGFGKKEYKIKRLI